MKIKKDEPLPYNTIYDYHECLAKLLLEKYVFHKSGYLSIADKPDLYNMEDSIGIEVAQAINERQQEAERLYSLLFYKSKEKQKKMIAQIEKCGCKLTDFSMTGISDANNYNRVNERIIKKIEKIEKGIYAKYNTQCIFLFSDILANKKMLSDELEYLKSLKQNKVKFIFINFANYIYTFDLEKNEYNEIKISDEDKKIIPDAAREMVELKECEKDNSN